MVRGAGEGGGECEQETEEEEDAGGRVVDVAGAKVMGISFSREFAGSVCTSSSPVSFFFPRTAFRPPSFLYSTLYEDHGACIPLEGVLQLFARRAHRFRDDIFSETLSRKRGVRPARIRANRAHVFRE